MQSRNENLVGKLRNSEYNRTKIMHCKAGPTLPKGGAGRRLDMADRCPIRSSLLSLQSRSGLSYLHYNCIYFIFELSSESKIFILHIVKK